MKDSIRLGHVIGVIIGVLFLLAALQVDAKEAKGRVTITILKAGEETFSKCIVRLTKKYRPRTGFQAAQITAICRKQMQEIDFRRD